MNQPYQYQPSEREVIRQRIDALVLKQYQIAYHLNRSQGSIARSLRGDRMLLLARIVKLLDRLERRKQSTKSDQAVAI